MKYIIHCVTYTGRSSESLSTDYSYHFSLCVWTYGIATRQANRSLTKHTQMTADARNGPCCYACIPNTSIKCSHLCTDIPFEKESKSETLNLKLQTLSPLDSVLMDFLEECSSPTHQLHPVSLHWAWHFHKLFKWVYCIQTIFL